MIDPKTLDGCEALTDLDERERALVASLGTVARFNDGERIIRHTAVTFIVHHDIKAIRPVVTFIDIDHSLEEFQSLATFALETVPPDIIYGGWRQRYYPRREPLGSC